MLFCPQSCAKHSSCLTKMATATSPRLNCCPSCGVYDRKSPRLRSSRWSVRWTLMVMYSLWTMLPSNHDACDVRMSVLGTSSWSGEGHVNSIFCLLLNGVKWFQWSSNGMVSVNFMLPSQSHVAVTGGVLAMEMGLSANPICCVATRHLVRVC